MWSIRIDPILAEVTLGLLKQKLRAAAAAFLKDSEGNFIEIRTKII